MGYFLKNWFSNFDPIDTRITDDFGIVYNTVENAFQAAKSVDKDIRYKISLMSPNDSKKEGYRVVCVPNWDSIKLGVMFNFLCQKYKQDPKHRKQLIKSDPFEIVEWNNWHDNYWGVCVCERCQDKEKHNHLGKLIMKIRKQLLNEVV